jgi:hypothetical protein
MSIFTKGYYTQDITGDGLIESADFSMMENNVSQNVTSLHP